MDDLVPPSPEIIFSQQSGFSMQTFFSKTIVWKTNIPTLTKSLDCPQQRKDTYDWLLHNIP